MISVIVDTMVISFILYGGVFLMIKLNPRSQLHNYPEQVRKTVPGQNKEDKKVAFAVGIPVFILLVFYITASFYLRFHGSDISWWQVLLRWIAVYLLTCAVDLFICDYFIFCTVTPKFIVIPGTEGNPGYKDKSCHTKTIPRMIVICVVLGILTSLTYFLR